MSYDGIQAEPKNQYLNNLITLDFFTATSLYRLHRYADAIYGVEQLMTMINGSTVSELKPLSEKIDLIASSGDADVVELKDIYKKLHAYLFEHWFSELHLGVIPTSTLPGKEERPNAAPINPNQSSRI